MDKIIQVNILNKRIWELKDKLKLDHEIKIFVNVNNRTFPRHSDDIVKRYNESYAVYNKNYKPNENLINGNFTNIDDVYNIRKNLLHDRNDILKSSLSSINNNFMNLPMFQKHFQSIKNDKLNISNELPKSSDSNHLSKTDKKVN